MPVEVTVNDPFTYEDPPDGSHLTIVDPYDGCTIGCPYCFQREDPAWSNPLIVKTNLPELLLSTLAEHPCSDPVYVGSRCDPYMPIEAYYSLTRRCLAVLSECQVPSYLCTKAGPDLVYRDLDILRGFKAELTVVLGLTNLSQIVQAGGSGSTKNMELVRRLHCEGVTVWAFVMPVLTGITDVHAIMDALPPAVPLWLYDLKMTDKSPNAPGFMTFVAKHYPHLVEEYRQMLSGRVDLYYNALQDEFCANERVKFPYG